MKKKLQMVFSFLVGVMIISSCGYPSVQIPVTGNQGAANAIEQNTVVASVAQTLEAQASLQATQEATSTPVVITATPQQTFTPEPTYTPYPPLPSQAPAAAAPACDQAAFINDITVPDGTTFSPGDHFVKTWRLQNTGTCTWTTAYKAVFDRGDTINGPTVINMPHTAAPGQIVDLSANMIAPTSSGTYEGFWSLMNTGGFLFGFGPNRNIPFDVLIVVGSTPAAFAVIHANVTASPESGSVSCPPGKKFTFSADIAVNG
jgi:hypothetical protein